MRAVKPAVYVAAAGAFSLLSFLALRNLWDGSADSDAKTYIALGAWWAVLSLACLTLAYRALRHR